MVVDSEEHGSRLTRSVTQPDRGSTAIGPDLDERQSRTCLCSEESGFVQCVALGLGHEAGCCESRSPQFGRDGHDVRIVTIAASMRVPQVTIGSPSHHWFQ
jgi:hypothetical protein